MINGNLEFKNIMSNKTLVSDICFNFIVNNYTEEEIENIFVTEIDTNLY